MLKRGLIGAGGMLGGVSLFGPRGVFGGGATGTTLTNIIDYITIATTGNATDFGDLTQARSGLRATTDGTRGVFGGGFATVTVNTIDYITIATTGNALGFGNLTQARREAAATSDGSRGVFGGGSVFTPPSTTTAFNIIDYITIATTGNAVDFGDLSAVRIGSAAVSDGTRGVFGGGQTTNAFGTVVNIIEYITIATTGGTTDFGDLTLSRTNLSAASDGSRGVFTVGTPSNASFNNTMDYITIATTGNAVDFGDGTNENRAGSAATSDGARGVLGGGAFINISYFPIATTGNAVNFGNLTVLRNSLAATSGG